MKPRYYLLILLTALLSNNQLEAGIPEERAALISLYNATDGPNWINSDNWLSENPLSTWYGVSRISWVYDLNLENNGLSGDIPNEFTNLVDLRLLHFRKNSITSLPSEIDNMNELLAIEVDWNLLTSLPEKLWNMTQLTGLSVGYNSITSISPNIGNLVNLIGLGLNDNELTSLPSEIGNLTSLSSLLIENNQLTSVPSEIVNFIDLSIFSAQGNQLSSLPAGFWNLTNLLSVQLQDNQFTAIPSDIKNLAKLTLFDISDNLITALPSEIELTNLSALYIGGNPLVSLSEIWNISSLGYLRINNIQLNNLSSDIGKLNLIHLRVDENNLTSLPTEIWDMTGLGWLDLSKNNFSIIPEEINNLVNLQGLFLNDNNLTDIPTLQLATAVSGDLEYLNNGIAIDFKNEIQHELETKSLKENNVYYSEFDPIKLNTKNIKSMPLVIFDVSNNKLTFEDIEPYIGVTYYTYAPQDSVGTSTDITLYEGNPYTMSAIVGGTANQYQWKLNGIEIIGATNSTFDISEAGFDDIGQYTCNITNTLATELTLYRRSININVIKKCTNGAIIYNTESGKFNFCEDGMWVEK